MFRSALADQAGEGPCAPHVRARPRGKLRGWLSYLPTNQFPDNPFPRATLIHHATKGLPTTDGVDVVLAVIRRAAVSFKLWPLLPYYSNPPCNSRVPHHGCVDIECHSNGDLVVIVSFYAPRHHTNNSGEPVYRCFVQVWRFYTARIYHATKGYITTDSVNITLSYRQNG